MTDENGFPAPFDYDLVCTLCERVIVQAGWGGGGGRVERSAELTFLPSGIALRSTSTLACARTSAEADMLTRKSTTI